MNIWDVFEFNNARLNKDQSGRSLTPEQFNIVAQIISFEYFKLKIGLPELYRPGLPIAPQQWQVGQKITDDCRHLLTWMGGPDKALMSMDKWGVANVPTDYIAFSSCYADEVKNGVLKPRTIDFLGDDKWANRVSSPIKSPTKKYPIAKWIGSQIQFAPADMRYVHFTYLREPVKPVLAYTYDGNNDIVYDEDNSVQFDWPQICLSDIANMIFEIQSTNISDQLKIQLAQARKAQGV